MAFRCRIPARLVFGRLGSNAIIASRRFLRLRAHRPLRSNLHRYPHARTGLDERDIAALQFGSHRPQFLPECSNLGEERPSHAVSNDGINWISSAALARARATETPNAAKIKPRLRLNAGASTLMK